MMNEIIPSLYIGNYQDAAQFGGHFEMVVNCTPSLPFALPNHHGVRVRIPIDDDPQRNSDMLHVAMYSGILEQIHKVLSMQKKTVLVHCHAGMQRSCAIVACYLVKYYGLPLLDAMRVIQQARPVAFHGGATFWPALVAFEKMSR